MNNDKMFLVAMALIPLVVIAIYWSKQYENLEASVTAGPFKFDVKAGSETTTLVNIPFAAEALAAKC